MQKILNYILTFSFVLFLTFMGISYFFKEEQTFSQNENRTLQTFPKFTLNNLLDGSFMSDIESYINDQVLFRDEFMEFKTDIMLLAKNKDINGVYIGEDGYLLQKVLPSTFNYKQLNYNLNCINEFASKVAAPIYSMLIPSSFSILQDKLPSNASSIDELEVIKDISSKYPEITFIDATTNLENHKKEYIYYKTDHHWTTVGAFYAYQAWHNADDKDLDSYDIKEVSTDFLGSLYSKVLNNNTAFDKIELFYQKNQINYEVTYNFNQKKSDTLYDFSKLKTKDQYQIFLGGNYPEITIHTSNNNNHSILLFKDSFANAFIPFLLNDYENIYIIDLRYFNKYINTYLEDKDIDEILFLYNLYNLSEDTSLRKL